MDVDNLDDFLRGLIDFFVTLVLVFSFILSILGLVVAVSSNHGLEGTIGLVRVDEKLRLLLGDNIQRLSHNRDILLI